ncbi:hypothetical protein GCM10027440_09890 [Nocardiopsis coralliicola]
MSVVVSPAVSTSATYEACGSGTSAARAEAEGTRLKARAAAPVVAMTREVTRIKKHPLHKGE